MTLLSRNVDLGKALKLSSWRKVAIGTWRTAGDPSVYGMQDLDATAALAYVERLRKESGLRITLSHFVGRAVAETFKRHPQINCILRWGRLYPRKSVDVFFQVATDMQGEDLSGMTVRQADTKSVPEIAREMEERVRKIKERKDKSFDKMKGIFKLLPGWLSSVLLNASGFLMYGLNLWSPLLGTPRDPFGSVMVTNIGSLGLDTAFAPLVPYSRVPILIAVGAVREAVVARSGQAVIIPQIRLCVTFDHRIIDGVQASHMSKTISRIFADPDKELG